MYKQGLFYQASRGRNEWYYYIFGVLIVILAYAIGQLPLYIGMAVKSVQSGEGMALIEEFQVTQDFSIFGFDKNVMFVFLLTFFLCAMAALLLVIRKLHQKRVKDLITTQSRYNWKKIFFSFAFWFGVTLVIEMVNYFMNPDDYTLQFQLGPFAVLLILAVLLIPIQTSFEELFLRGYLMQGMSLIFRNKWLPLIITSLAFGSLHLMNPEVKQYGMSLMLTYYVSAGLIMGLMTIFDDSLELALGAHAAINLYAALVVTYQGSALDTHAIFRTGEVDPSSGLIGFAGMAVIFFAICTWKYKWKPLQALGEQLNFPENTDLASPLENHEQNIDNII